MMMRAVEALISGEKERQQQQRRRRYRGVQCPMCDALLVDGSDLVVVPRSFN